MAPPKITGMIRRKARRDAKGGVPAVGDLRQRRVERFAQTRDDLRQRIGEVAVLAAAAAVTCHDAPAAEPSAILVAADQGLANLRADAAWQHLHTPPNSGFRHATFFHLPL